MKAMKEIKVHRPAYQLFRSKEKKYKNQETRNSITRIAGRD